MRSTNLPEQCTFELHASKQYGPDRVVRVCHCTGCQHWSGSGGGENAKYVIPEDGGAGGGGGSSHVVNGAASVSSAAAGSR